MFERNFQKTFSPPRRRESAETRRVRYCLRAAALRTLCVSTVSFLFCFTAAFQQTVLAQTLEVNIKVLSAEPAKIIVAGKTSGALKRFTWINFYANADNLAARIENIKFYNSQNEEAVFSREETGVYKIGAAVNRFSYEMKLDFPADPAQAAHISWLNKGLGLIQLGDLLPDFAEKNSAKILFELPAGWKIATNENKTGANQYQTADFENAVFLLGDFSEHSIKAGKNEIKLARVGDWSFSEAETLDNAAKVLAEHIKVFGGAPANKIQIILLPFPQNFGGERWEAETRGSTVVLLSGVNAFKSRAVSRLQEQLRHELFHLWLPNSLNLQGDYAWFYEGFTVYQALKTGVRLKQIRFVDFLDTLSRAFDAARRSPHNKTLSLIEASRLRWSINSAEFVYAKGMVAAFLCDLALLNESKKTLDDVFKELHRRHQFSAPRQNANEAVLNLLKSSPELTVIVEKYVETSGELDWTSEITAGGLQDNRRGSFTFLAVGEKLSGRQRKLLEKLGYNHQLKGL